MVTESSGNGYALYGGVKLPNIDTVWTDEVKETHPYACIQNNDDTAWFLVLSDVRPIYDGERVYVFNEDSGSEQPLYFYSPSNGATEWTAIGTAFGVSSADWTNTDILNSDGATYLSASDPTPLDGMNVIEWDGDTEGLEGITVQEGITAYPFAEYTDVSNAVCVATYADGSKDVVDNFNTTNAGWQVGGWAYGVKGIAIGLATIEDEGAVNYCSLLAYTPATEDDTAETPTFTVNLSGAYTYTQGDTADTLSVTAEVSDGGTITYQWFMDDAEISGATDSGYTPATDTVGTRTYFCRVTNTLESGLTASADSDAVTVKVKFDIRGFVTGYLLTLAKGLLTVKREPVAYLYNGVQLPALPEWNRGNYPYAYVAVNNSAVTSGAKFYMFYAVQEAAIYRSNSYGTWWSIAAGKRLYATFTDYTDTTIPDSQWSKLWSDIAESDSDSSTTLGYEDGAYSRSVVWCNTDMVRPDGTVFLEATEPIPVYE